MRKLTVVFCLAIIGAACVPKAAATDEQFPGGWCSFKLNGQDPSEPQDYEFNNFTGVLTIKNDGFWQILYQDRQGFGTPGAIPVDIPGVLSEYSLGGDEISVDLRGESVIGVISLNYVNASNNRRLRLILQNGGSVSANVVAGSYSMANTSIDGHVLSWATISVKAIVDIAVGTELDIGGDLAGRLDVLEDIGSPSINSRVRIRGNVTASGRIDLGGALRGRINIDGDLLGPLTVGGNLSGVVSVTNINNDIHIAGDLAASGRIAASGGLSAKIQIDGSMFNGDEAHEIDITGSMGAQGAVAVDYDGSDLEHTWQDGASVHIGQQTFYGNNTANRVYDITCLKGDLNNDDAVDSYDIDPFVMAISDHSPGGAYDQAYPGLFGSVDYHANTDCKDGLNAFDIDAFVLRLVNPPVYYDTYPGCEECPDPLASGASGGTSPEDVAALLIENVAQARLPLVIEFARFLAAHFGNTARGQFWADVLAWLE